jgi:hypothetical protein
MRRLVWVRTAPPDVPGSMAAYGELVRRAVEPLATGWEFASCDLFDPRGGGSMWRHHLWRLRKARRVLAAHSADLTTGWTARWRPSSRRPCAPKASQRSTT